MILIITELFRMIIHLLNTCDDLYTYFLKVKNKDKSFHKNQGCILIKRSKNFEKSQNNVSIHRFFFIKISG